MHVFDLLALIYFCRSFTEWPRRSGRESWVLSLIQDLMSRLSELCPFHPLLIVIPVLQASEIWAVFSLIKSLFVVMVWWSIFPERPTQTIFTSIRYYLSYFRFMVKGLILLPRVPPSSPPRWHFSSFTWQSNGLQCVHVSKRMIKRFSDLCLNWQRQQQNSR